VMAKAFSGPLVGLFVSIVEVAFVIIFLQILSRGSLGGWVYDPQLVILSAVVIYLIILSTLALSLIVISESATMRTAQIASSMIMITSSSIFFSAPYVDLDILPIWILGPLTILQYTHSVLAIKTLSIGDLMRAVTHLGYLLLFLLTLIIASSHMLNEENIHMKPK